MSPLIIAIVGAVLLVLFIAMFILSRISVAGPNEAFIVTGRKGKAIRAADGTTVTDLSGQKVVMGRVRVRDAGRATPVQARPVQPGDPGTGQRRGQRPGHPL